MCRMASVRLVVDLMFVSLLFRIEPVSRLLCAKIDLSRCRLKCTAHYRAVGKCSFSLDMISTRLSCSRCILKWDFYVCGFA